MKKSPNILSVDQVLRCAKDNQTYRNNRWVATRPMGYQSFLYKLKAAYLVYKGRADALIWPEGQ